MSDNAQKRLLLCRPQGGLNDILSEIGKCINYATRFNRTVVVETDYHDLTHFNDRFTNYFVSTDNSLVLDALSVRSKFDQLAVAPQFITGRVNSYKGKQNPVGMDLATEQLVTFDFNQDYSEPLLVHHSNGQQKGRNSLVALTHLQLGEKLKAELNNRLAKLGADYTAVHIRHTDYKTDYERRVMKLKPKIGGRVFVATDNRDVVTFCKSVFGSANVLSFSKLPEDSGVPLHYLRGSDGAFDRNSDAILDLFTLALAKDYYFYPRMTDRFRLAPRYSGFSILADRLRHEPGLLHQVVSGKTDENLRVASTFSNKWREVRGR
jgi:hypothetical protein